jgi:hypothetical protein
MLRLMVDSCFNRRPSVNHHVKLDIGSVRRERVEPGRPGGARGTMTQ